MNEREDKEHVINIVMLTMVIIWLYAHLHFNMASGMTNRIWSCDGFHGFLHQVDHMITVRGTTSLSKTWPACKSPRNLS